MRENDQADVNFISDLKFSAFKCTLDTKMKELQASGNYMPKKCQSTKEHEDILWENGLLGNHSLQALIDTVVFNTHQHGFLTEKWRGASMSQVPSSQIELVGSVGGTLTSSIVRMSLMCK